MFPALFAAIPALMSLFGGAGAATAGAAGAGAAGAAGAAGGAAGGLGGLLGGLFGGASGGAAASGAATTAAEALPELAGAGSSGGFLGGAPAAGGAGGGGGAGGIFGQLLGGVAQQGGGGMGGLLNMANEIAGGPGRAYMTGAMAGKGDFKGAMNAMDQHSAVLDRQARTGILGQGNQREQEKFEIAKGQQAKTDAANLQIQKIFEDPKALDNLTETLPKVIAPLLTSGNHQGAHDVLTMLTKAATDKTENSAALAAGDIVRGSRKADGSFDWQSAEDKLAALGNPHAVKAFNALRPSLAAEGTATNQANLQKDRVEDNARQDKRNAELSAQFQQGQARMGAQFVEGQNRADARQAASNAAITERINQRPMEASDRQAVSSMEENLRIANELKNGFTDAERKQWIGILKGPAARAQQLSKEDPRFARFQTLSNEAKGFAFAEGGKNLTETEKQITWGHLPTGTEWSYENYNANLDRTIERTGSLINRRIDLATSPRSRIREQGGSSPEKPAPLKQGGPSKDEIDAAKKRLGIK